MSAAADALIGDANHESEQAAEREEGCIAGSSDQGAALVAPDGHDPVHNHLGGFAKANVCSGGRDSR